LCCLSSHVDLLFLITLIGFGALLTKLGWFSAARVSWVNKYIIYIALPAVALAKIPGLTFSVELLAPIMAPLLVFGVAALIFLVLLRSIFTPGQRIVLTILGGLGNTSFIGFPLVAYYYGNDQLSTAVIYDQVTFLLVATITQWLIVRNEHSYNPTNSLIKVLTFPAFIALLIAIWMPPSWVSGSLEYVLDGVIWTISPLAMLIVGFQVARFVDLSFDKPVVVGIFYKLIIAPLLIFFILRLTHISDSIFNVTVLESGMAAMITPSLLLLDKNVETRLSSQLLSWSTLISFVTTYLIVLLLR
jgi:predicted permease